MIQRWGKRRNRRFEITGGKPRSWHSTLIGASGRGDLQAIKRLIEKRGGIKNITEADIDYLYKAAFVNYRDNVILWLVTAGANFWNILKNRDWDVIFPHELYYVGRYPQIQEGIMKLVSTEHKYCLVVCWERNTVSETTNLATIPFDTIRYISDWL